VTDRCPDRVRGVCARGVIALVGLVMLLAASPCPAEQIYLAFEGQIHDPGRIKEVVRKLYDFCQTEQLPCEYLARPGRDGYPFVSGVRFKPGASAKWAEFSFEMDGKISGKILTYPGGPLVHHRVITMLETLQAGVPGLAIIDSTGYAVTRDPTGLSQTFERRAREDRGVPSKSEEPSMPMESKAQAASSDDSGRGSAGVGGVLAAVVVIGIGLYLIILAVRGGQA
jgi:hypothetical protein